MLEVIKFYQKKLSYERKKKVKYDKKIVDEFMMLYRIRKEGDE